MSDLENRFELSESTQARYTIGKSGIGGAEPTVPGHGPTGRIVLRTIASWRSILLAGVAAGVFSLIGYSAYRHFSPRPVTYSHAITVTMADVEKGRYPNGAPYSATDLRSAPVLEEVYRANGIQEYGVSLATFQGYVSVESYSPSYTFFVDRYRERLSNKTLTFEEKKSIEEEFRTAESSLKASGLVVNLTLPENSKIPDSIARKTLLDIPAKWGEVFVDRLGVANLPLLASGADLIDLKLAQELDYPLAYDYLDGQAGGLRTSIENALSVPGASTYFSKQTGKSLADLSREFDSIYRYRIQMGLKPLIDKGLSKDPSTTSLIYQNAIASLDRDADAQSGYADSIQSILESFRKSASSGSSASGTANPSVTTQIDGAFVDKIVELTSKGEGLEFEQELQREKLRRQNDKVSITEQKSRFSDRLSAMQGGLVLGVDRQKLEEKFKTGFDVAVEDLNSLWKQTAAIASELGMSKLNSEKSLYRLSDLPESRKISKPPLIDNLAMLLSVIAALVAMILVAGLRSIGPEMKILKGEGNRR